MAGGERYQRIRAKAFKFCVNFYRRAKSAGFQSRVGSSSFTGFALIIAPSRTAKGPGCYCQLGFSRFVTTAPPAEIGNLSKVRLG